ncbi:hypothetical protein KB879_01575 [Cupriavidus sp. KK10]|jgi:hypothetical protein|uniref:hypothetical protein n=1 Tax=Cupriavidus sp. KK10 TaxID=1478019 RepID=UPI001BAB01C1|nr:hypothetical protein [Cupriavidus sp. KK10]QUN28690.1 hypothetical protein KB879_01575 [Cupriavidus sp. KK10]
MLTTAEEELLRHRIAHDTHGWQDELHKAYGSHKAECAHKGMIGSGYFSQQAGNLTIEAYRKLNRNIAQSLSTALSELDLAATEEDETRLITISGGIAPSPERMQEFFLQQHPSDAFGEKPMAHISEAVYAACANARSELHGEIRYTIARHEQLLKRRKEQQAMSIVFNGAANIGALQTGASSIAHVSQTTNSSPRVAEMLDELLPLIKATSISEGEKKEFSEVVSECSGAARSGKINKSKISMLLGGLKAAAGAAKDGQALFEATTKGFELLSNFNV